MNLFFEKSLLEFSVVQFIGLSNIVGCVLCSPVGSLV